MKMQEVKLLIENGNYKTALLGAKNFRIGVTAEQRSVMARAYECYIRPSFYQSIGKDPALCISAGIAILKGLM